MQSPSEFCSKCDKASESALNVKSTECKLVNSQLVLCEEQRSCAAWGAHTSANCAAITADFQAFPFRLPRRGLCLCSSSALLVGTWSREQGSSLQPPPDPACTELLFLWGSYYSLTCLVRCENLFSELYPIS